MSKIEIQREPTIPSIEIGDGWYVEDVENREDCEDAVLYLEDAITRIETSIELIEAELDGFIPPPPDRQPTENLHERKIRANTALKYKKIALKHVNLKRMEIDKEESRLLAKERNETVERKLLKHFYDALGAYEFHQHVVAAGIADDILLFTSLKAKVKATD